MNTSSIRNALKLLSALSAVLLMSGTCQAQAAQQRIEHLPRVVVTGKSLQAKAAEARIVVLPRVVVTGHRRQDVQLASCPIETPRRGAAILTLQC